MTPKQVIYRLNFVTRRRRRKAFILKPHLSESDFLSRKNVNAVTYRQFLRLSSLAGLSKQQV